MSKKPLTMIEVMVAITLILIAVSTLSFKMYGMIAKKRFSSSVERLRSRLQTCRRLAMNMQSDWRSEFTTDGKESHLISECTDDSRIPNMPKLSLGPIELVLDGQVKQKISFDFTSSGDIFPQGKLQIRSGDLAPVEWEMNQLFSLEKGTKAGPAHPKDW